MNLFKCVFIFLALLQACAVARGQNSAVPARFVQKEFAIGLWVPPQFTEGAGDHHKQIVEAYKECADANFTLVIGTSSITAAEQIELCNRVGLKAIVDATGPADQ